MKWVEYMNQFALADGQNITHTSMKGGKWNIPEEDIPKFYKKLNKYLEKYSECIVERLGDIHPFIIDIDLK